MVAHAPTSPHMPVQCGPARWLDAYGTVQFTGPSGIRFEPASPADYEAARWLTWWQSPAGRRFHGARSLNLSGGRTLRVELAATLQGRFAILYAVRDAAGRILPGQSVVQSGQDPNEVFDALISPSTDRLPAGWLV